MLQNANKIVIWWVSQVFVELADDWKQLVVGEQRHIPHPNNLVALSHLRCPALVDAARRELYPARRAQNPEGKLRQTS